MNLIFLYGSNYENIFKTWKSVSVTIYQTKFYDLLACLYVMGLWGINTNQELVLDL